MVSSAVSGKAARVCDDCIKKHARWYCTADDVFLCQACDALVHLANPLGHRHKRVRLKTSSFQGPEESNPENSAPSWHHGFTRKARTPRQGNQRHKSNELAQDLHSPVPELGGGGTSNEELEEQHVHRVPIIDPLISQLCNSTNINEQKTFADGLNKLPNNIQGEISQGMGNLHGILPSDMELDQFAADVESLQGKGFDDGSFDMESFGSLDCNGKEIISIKGENEMVMFENEEDGLNFMMTENQGDTEIDLTREKFELNLDYDSPLGEEEETKVGFGGGIFGGKCEGAKNGGGNCNKRKLLRLDYEGVIAAWANHRSPWTTGDRPELDPNDCWPDCLGSCGLSSHLYPLGDMGGVMRGWNSMMVGDDQREARVSRYREKRRTRLFSKKIRYEVRKLNAEKRPRMKGRFVKRTTNAVFALPSKSAFPVLDK